MLWRVAEYHAGRKQRWSVVLHHRDSDWRVGDERMTIRVTNQADRAFPGIGWVKAEVMTMQGECELTDQ